MPKPKILKRETRKPKIRLPKIGKLKIRKPKIKKPKNGKPKIANLKKLCRNFNFFHKHFITQPKILFSAQTTYLTKKTFTKSFT